jgi:glucose-1-phosphate thymidylyltransferase
MNGVILAGGNGTRLFPLTKITNKHLLPVYNKPMIFYPLEFLRKCGLKDIMLVVGKEHAGSFAELLGDGSEYGLNLTYKVQEDAKGIAHALGLIRDNVKDEGMLVILGDNIFELKAQEISSMKTLLADFKKRQKPNIFLKEIGNPNRFGVPVLDNNKRIIKIEEKPKVPKSNYAVTGLYLYTNDVFDRVRKLKPSGRGELEITDINNSYIDDGLLDYKILKGEWTDAGTFESLFKASELSRAVYLNKNSNSESN